jgi:hypothetical protein
MSEEKDKAFDEMLEDVLGGEPETVDHSPDPEGSSDKSLGADEDAPKAEDTFDPYGEEYNSFADDSAQAEAEDVKQEGTPEKTDSVPEEKNTDADAEKAALQEKIANYEKRLHDTQTAMHKANEERAKLKKELEDLKKRSESSGNDDDNWFSDKDSGNADDGKTAELESKIDALEEQQKQYQQEQALQQWNIDAEKVIAEHDDFKTLVYEKLEPLLDEETGDPAVLAAYTRWKDKTPAGAYAFAKKMFSVETPEKETKQEAKPTIDPNRGKAGLDRMNSADFSEPARAKSNMIDEVFG